MQKSIPSTLILLILSVWLFTACSDASPPSSATSNFVVSSTEQPISSVLESTTHGIAVVCATDQNITASIKKGDTFLGWEANLVYFVPQDNSMFNKTIEWKGTMSLTGTIIYNTDTTLYPSFHIELDEASLKKYLSLQNSLIGNLLLSC